MSIEAIIINHVQEHYSDGSTLRFFSRFTIKPASIIGMTITASGVVIDVIVISRRPLFVSDTSLIDADHTTVGGECATVPVRRSPCS